jgi:hypothetical protein
MNFHIVKKILFLFSIILSSNFKVIATDQGMEEKKNNFYLVCTTGAEKKRVREILYESKYDIIGIDLSKASQIENSSSLFEAPMTNIQSLKLKFNIDDFLKILPTKTPNLEILDISGTNISNGSLLNNLNTLSSLRILDISNIHYFEKLPEIIENFLLQNKELTIYISCLRRLFPQQPRMDLSIYKDNPRIILNTLRTAHSNYISTSHTISELLIY